MIAGPLELISLSGTLSRNGSHQHAGVADSHGHVRGGHVMPGYAVRTTAEIVLALLPQWALTREHDAQTGFMELIAKRRWESAIKGCRPTHDWPSGRWFEFFAGPRWCCLDFAKELIMDIALKKQVRTRMPKHHKMFLPATLIALIILLMPGVVFSQGLSNGGGGRVASGPTGTTAGTGAGGVYGSGSPGAPAATSGATLGAVGRTVNGSSAGTSGTDPGVSTPTSQTAGQTDSSTRTAPGPSGMNPGDPQAGAIAGFINRNPAARSSSTQALVPSADSADSSGRSTQGAGNSSTSRDTIAAPDPSRDSVRTE